VGIDRAAAFHRAAVHGVVAALAVLFETVGWLRGGFGNVVYFFLFIMALVPGFETEPYQPMLDLTGFRLIGDHIAQAAKLTYPESESGFAFQIVTAATEVKYFLYNGIEWTPTSSCRALPSF
jgi:hypothetical protein